MQRPFLISEHFDEECKNEVIHTISISMASPLVLPVAAAIACAAILHCVILPQPLVTIVICVICVCIHYFTSSRPDSVACCANTAFALSAAGAAVLAVYHCGEFFAIALSKPANVDNFVVNHSTAYVVAMFSAAFEYWIVYLFFPAFKPSPRVLVLFGLLLVLSADTLRKASMLQAGRSFTHLIARHKVEGHVLVTSGIYRVMRHPSYSAWMLWSVGTQILLCNPICTVLYAIAAVSFFQDRVEDEERSLVGLFGEEYRLYCARTPLYLPFVKSDFPFISRTNVRPVKGE